MEPRDDLLRLALTLVDNLADLDDPDRFAEVALPDLARLIRCDVVTYNKIVLDSPPSNHVDSHTEEPAVFAAYVRPVDPARVGGFLLRSPLDGADDRGEFLRFVPGEYQMAMALLCPGGLVALAFHRTDREFTGPDRAVLDALRDPLRNALRRASERHEGRSTGVLTGRESRVLELVARGHTNAAIAQLLDLSPRTVAKHLERIYRKLGVNSRAAACRTAPPPITALHQPVETGAR